MAKIEVDAQDLAFVLAEARRGTDQFDRLSEQLMFASPRRDDMSPAEKRAYALGYCHADNGTDPVVSDAVFEELEAEEDEQHG